MDMNENNNNFGLEKGHGDHLSSHNSGISAEWQFNSQAMSAVPANASIAAGLVTPVTSSPYSSPPMVEPFVPGLWNHHNNSPNMGLAESNVPSTTGANCIPTGKPVAMSSKGMLLPAGPRIFPPNLPHLPADLAFIERAGRFSCFSAGHFSGMNLSESIAPLTNSLKDVMGAQLQKTELNTTENKVVSLPAHHPPIDGSPTKNQRDWESPHIGISNSESREANFTEDDEEGKTNSADVAGNSFPSDLGANKRRRTIQLVKGGQLEKDQVQRDAQSSSETTKENTEAKQKFKQNSSNNSGKYEKDHSEVAKEDYVHVRARRGQATNSHSIAERLRREKISERMKYLQELVPGCSKVTGKAVMLDEIINYVQSLQRQVEFLSMKLAAVSPQLDFSIEGLLAKNILHSHGGSSSATGFSQEMIYPRVYSSQQGLVHVGISAMVNPSDAFRRAMNTQLLITSGYKESLPQTHNPWNEELAQQMTYGANSPPNDKPDGFTT